MIDWDLAALLWFIGAMLLGVVVGLILDDEQTDKAFPPSYAGIVLWPLTLAVMFGGAIRAIALAILWLVVWAVRKAIPQWSRAK